MDQLDKDRKRFAETKRLSFWKRRKCDHEYVFLYIRNCDKMWGCVKCGKTEWR